MRIFRVSGGGSRRPPPKQQITIESNQKCPFHDDGNAKMLENALKSIKITKYTKYESIFHWFYRH